jgi:hypothetical protein
MHLNDLREVKMQKLCHHTPIREVPVDVTFGSTEWYAIDHLINILKFLASEATHTYLFE